MKNERIVIIDALRGFALFLIIIIHYVEHLELFKDPEVNFVFSNAFDKDVLDTVFLLISGKAYSIFALLFGLSLFIQIDNKAKIGKDYRNNFAWRMVVLLVIGFFHSLIYRGDILHIYALLSFPILLVYNLKTKYLWAIAIVLVLQIPMIYSFIQSMVNPNYEYTPLLKNYFDEGNEIYASGNFWEVVKYNLWKGRQSVWSWSIENGRHLQLLALFIVGIILGRNHTFHDVETNRKGFVKVLVISAVSHTLVSIGNYGFQNSGLADIQKQFINTFLSSLTNLAITSILITLFCLIYIKVKKAHVFGLLAAYGKLSLTNYMFQTVFGVVFFYGFGLAMYKYLGSTWSVILGILIFIVQAFASVYWNKRYYYGPVEWLWRCLTNLDFSIPFKRSHVEK
jgi:uncharacterized protein